MKFQATYRVTVYNQENTIIIGAHEETDKDNKTILVQDEAQLTCHFNVTRGILSDSNKCTIQLYNLAPSTREQIFQDAFQIDPSKWKFVKLEAGYDDDLTPIFMGRILQAYSHRQGGQTDIITTIQAQALDMFDCQASYTFAAGTSKKEALQTIVTGSMPNVKIGNIGNLEGSFQTPTTFDGNAMENISKLTGGNAFVDNDQLNVLMSNEVIDVPVPVITEENGLLDTPDRRDANLEVKMLFEPSLITGQLLEIKSGVSPNFNGQFKVMGFTHDCLISGSQAGQRVTTVDLYIGPFLPGAEQILNGNKTSNFNKVSGSEISRVVMDQTLNFIKPVNGIITSPFGWRQAPNAKASRGHKGIDIGVNVGTPVKAPADGTAYTRGYDANGYGYYMDINHGVINGYNITTRYGHLSKFVGRNGAKVKQGQVIALSGNTGNSTGPHLHFEIRANGTPINPQQYMKI